MLADKIYKLLGVDTSVPLSERIVDLMTPGKTLRYKREEPIVPPKPKTYQLQGRDVSLTDADIEEARHIAFSEIGNRDDEKRKLETRVVLNTAINRVKERTRKTGKPHTLTSILQEENQYQGYNSEQYKLSKSGNYDELAKRKIAIIDEVMNELRSGNFPDTTNGAYYYVHNDDQTITFDDKRPLYASK